MSLTVAFGTGHLDVVEALLAANADMDELSPTVGTKLTWRDSTRTFIRADFIPFCSSPVFIRFVCSTCAMVAHVGSVLQN